MVLLRLHAVEECVDIVYEAGAFGNRTVCLSKTQSRMLLNAYSSAPNGAEFRIAAGPWEVIPMSAFPSPSFRPDQQDSGRITPLAPPGPSISHQLSSYDMHMIVIVPSGMSLFLFCCVYARL